MPAYNSNQIKSMGGKCYEASYRRLSWV